jgi:hypothetical protein
LCLLLWYTVLWLRPIWLYQINDALKPYTDFTLPEWLGGVKNPIRLVLLVGFFHYHSRVLDAWIDAHIGSAREKFLKNSTVNERSVHISIPVILDGIRVAGLQVEHLQTIFAKKRTCLLIYGEGGSGKTSLACQLAQWAMSDDATERLYRYRIVPVLIEGELKKGKTRLVEAIQGQLQYLCDEQETITEELVERLLRQQRVLVIVDSFSEMTESTQSAICPERADFPANALIVTSRNKESLGVTPSVIQTVGIVPDHLYSFVSSYLGKIEKRSLFSNEELHYACGQLSAMMSASSTIPALIVKLYVKQMVSAKEGTTESDLPRNIPDLMLSYVNEINRGATNEELRAMQNDTKIIAWECLKKTYRPVAAKLDDVLQALGSEDAKVRLEHLELSLHLIRTQGHEQDRIRFTLDPLAEYLAGLHLLEYYGDNDQRWHEFLDYASGMPSG